MPSSLLTPPADGEPPRDAPSVPNRRPIDPCGLLAGLAHAIPLRKVPEYLPMRNGRRMSIPTVYRWVQHGVRGGKKLKVVHVGGSTYVLRSDLEDFLRSINGDAVLPAQAAPVAASVSAELDRLGI